MVDVGRMDKLVLLDDPVEDGTPVVFSPDRIWASIEPAPPGSDDEHKVTHEVRCYYHSQITFNTRLTYRGRYLYVRGVQNVEERNEELVLLCEEVKTP